MPGLDWTIIIATFLLSVGVELLAAAVSARVLRQFLAVLAMLLSALACGILLGAGVDLLALAFLALASYRGINASRLIRGRLHPHHLRRASLSASWGLGFAQLVTLAACYSWPQDLASNIWLSALAIGQLGVALVFLLAFRRQLHKSQQSSPKLAKAEHDFPTLTVAIPAKHEDLALAKCLESVLASDYPKLEVLVLDDSAGSRAGEIINSLAHEGARFILGEPAEGHWLAKNLAYDRLAREANGELVLFCGVDVRFGKSSLRDLVLHLLASHNDMLSVMPVSATKPRSLVVKPMRYFWELARPRLGSSQPVLSTCWMIRRSAFLNFGGLSAVKNEIIPERYFASQATASGGYNFILADSKLGVTSEKPPREQHLTAIRTRYPLLHDKITGVAMTSIFELIFLVGPVVILAVAASQHWWLAAACAGLACVVWLVIYGTVLRRQLVTNGLLAPLFFLASLLDIGLMNVSMLKYEFGTVMWKGRDVASGR